MSLTIRSATPADKDVIVAFNQWMAEESEGKILDAEQLGRGIAACLADPHKGRYFLAEEAGQVLGQIKITAEWSDWRFGWRWGIQAVYVRRDQRRRGVFRALFAHVHQAALWEPQVIGLRLSVEHDNQAAQQVYRNLGMTPTGYVIFEKYPLSSREGCDAAGS